MASSERKDCADLNCYMHVFNLRKMPRCMQGMAKIEGGRERINIRDKELQPELMKSEVCDQQTHRFNLFYFLQLLSALVIYARVDDVAW